MLACTRGAIALGPSGNTQGGHKFYTLDTRSVVVRRQWVRLPMTAAVIARLDLLAAGQPSQPVFTDRKGLPIGDIAMEHFDDNVHVDAADDDFVHVNAADEIPGVHLQDNDEYVEIPGVGGTDQATYDDVPDLANAFDVNIDFDTQANPPDLVQMDNDHAPDPEVGVGPVVGPFVGGTGGTSVAPTVVRRSTRKRKQVKEYQPTMTGQKYAFATMALVYT